MQQLGTTKSIFYGAIMMIIFMISSCEFGPKATDLSNNNSQPAKTLSDSADFSRNT